MALLAALLVALGEIAGLKRAISVKPAMFIW